MTTAKILVVEDQRIIAKNIKASLEKLGYDVLALVTSGEEAIETAAKLLPDLVLMDIRLSGNMDGVTAAEQIYSDLHIPIVYLTAHSDIATVKRATVTGAFGYILKPFKQQDLLATIETALNRYQLEKELKQSERGWTTALKSVGDAVIVTDACGRIKFLNSVAEALTGWKQEEALGRDPLEVFSIINENTRNAIANPVRWVLQEGVVIHLEDDAILVSKDSMEIPIGENAAPIEDERGNITGAVIVFRDLSDRKQAEKSAKVLERIKQLEQQMAELQRLNQLKDDFLSTVSHELRTPITNIKMGLKMLELSLARSSAVLSTITQPTASSGSASRYLQIVKDECGREIELLNNLLDLQRLEAGNSGLITETINLQEWLPELVEPFVERARNSQISLQVDLPADLPPLVSDPVCLGRILAELLNNACKYTPPGERIAIALSVAQGKMQIKVSNSGVEIPAQELPCIFDKFYRASSSNLCKQNGTGLGLALVQKLVESLGRLHSR